MEVITIESEAYKDLVDKLEALEQKLNSPFKKYLSNFIGGFNQSNLNIFMKYFFVSFLKAVFLSI